MINWKWWKKQLTDAHENRDVKFVEPSEMEQEEPTPEKDISEPVTSFIKCFETNPRRFKIEKIEPVTQINGFSVVVGYHSKSKYKLTDKQTGESWTVLLAGFYRENHRVHDNEWLTGDEVNLLVYTFAKYYSDRVMKLQRIKSDKYKAKMMKERDRLTKIYKENKE